MEVMLIYAWVVLTATMNFSFSFITCGVSRVFDGIYRGAIEFSVINYDSNGNKIRPYFMPDICAASIENYFSTNLTKYVREYSYQILFYSYESKLIDNTNPNVVDVFLVTDVPYIKDFSKSVSYMILEAINNG